MIAVVTETAGELLIDLLRSQRPVTAEPAGRRPGPRCPLPDQLVDLLRERDSIGGSQLMQAVTRGLRHLDGRHGHTRKYTGPGSAAPARTPARMNVPRTRSRISLLFQLAHLIGDPSFEAAHFPATHSDQRRLLLDT